MSILSSAVCVFVHKFCKFTSAHMLAYRLHTHIVHTIALMRINRLGTWAIRNSISPVGNISTPPHIANKMKEQRDKHLERDRARARARLHWSNLPNQRVVLAFLNICNEPYFFFVFSSFSFFSFATSSVCLFAHKTQHTNLIHSSALGPRWTLKYARTA